MVSHKSHTQKVIKAMVSRTLNTPSRTKDLTARYKFPREPEPLKADH